VKALEQRRIQCSFTIHNFSKFLEQCSQTVVRGMSVSAEVRQEVCGGPQTVSEESIVTTVSDTERMKNTPVNVSAKTNFVGWPSRES
jgi:hypothetical protein